MKKTGYNFKIDEALPEIPPAKDFNSLLGKVQSKKIWYQNPMAWGSFIVIAIVGILALIPTNHKKQSNTRNVQTPAASIVAENSNALPTDTTIERNEKIKPILTQVNNFPTDNSIVAHHDVKSDISTAEHSAAVMEKIIVKISPTVEVKNEPWFDLPFDTILLNHAENAQYVVTKSGCLLQIPAAAFTDFRGQMATGKSFLLYREARTAADIFASGINNTARNVKEGQLHMNGIFEIRAISNNQPIKIAKGKSLYVHFQINYKSPSFSGYRYSDSTKNWVSMLYTADYASDVKDTFMQYMPSTKAVRTNWWKRLWYRIIGKKIVEDGGEGYYYQVTKDHIYSPNNRTFEIFDFGAYSSAKPATESKDLICTVQLPAGKIIASDIFQFNLTQNTIKSVPLGNLDRRTVLQYTPGNSYVFFVKLDGSNQIAVVTAKEFERAIKKGKKIVLQFKTSSDQIKDLEAFKKALGLLNKKLPV